MASPSMSINTNTSVSTSVDVGNGRIVGMLFDGNFPTGKTLTLSSSNDGKTFIPVEDGAGSAVKITVGTPPCYVALNSVIQAQLTGVRYLQGTCNANATNTAVIILVTR